MKKFFIFIISGSLILLVVARALALGTLRDSYDTASTQDVFFGTTWIAMTFTATDDYDLDGIKAKLYRQGNPGTVTASIRATSSGSPTGSDLCGTATYNGDTITTNSNGEKIQFDFSSTCSITNGSVYAIVLRATSGSGSNWVYWKANSSGNYAGGAGYGSSNSGSTWTLDGREFNFETYGTDPAVGGGSSGTATTTEVYTTDTGQVIFNGLILFFVAFYGLIFYFKRS